MSTQTIATHNDEEWEGWKSFVSLGWYDGLIDFLFRFVAKTSEPLLAVGVIISAADFLMQGRLMQDNLFLASAWAWTQAIAIESSGGVVLLYALHSFREKDAIKAWLYIALAALLAMVGGVMLFTQIASSTTGIDLIAKGPLAFVIAMAVLRSVVSIAYVVMCRTKRIRFTTLEETPTLPGVDIAMIKSEVDQHINAALTGAIERMEASYQQRFDTVLQEVKRTVTTVVQEEVTQQHLLAIPRQSDSKGAMVIARSSASRLQASDSKIDRFATVKQTLIDSPDITDKALAEIAHCSINTVRKERKKALAELAMIAQEGA